MHPVYLILISNILIVKYRYQVMGNVPVDHNYRAIIDYKYNINLTQLTDICFIQR